MVKIVKVVNGQERVYEVGRNYVIGERIKGDKGGYKLLHHTDGFTSTIYFQSNNFFHDKTPKNIGCLLYDFTNDIVTYRKYGFKTSEHEFHKTDSIGLNWDIVSNLCPKDLISVVEVQGNKKIVAFNICFKGIKISRFQIFQTSWL